MRPHSFPYTFSSRDVPDQRKSSITLATIAEADREWARNVGIENPERAWILSDRDCWYPNPAYSGPPVPHPESDDISPEEAAAILAECEAAEERDDARSTRHYPSLEGDDDIPF